MEKDCHVRLFSVLAGKKLSHNFPSCNITNVLLAIHVLLLSYTAKLFHDGRPYHIETSLS